MSQMREVKITNNDYDTISKDEYVIFDVTVDTSNTDYEVRTLTQIATLRMVTNIN